MLISFKKTLYQAGGEMGSCNSVITALFINEFHTRLQPLCRPAEENRIFLSELLNEFKKFSGCPVKIFY